MSITTEYKPFRILIVDDKDHERFAIKKLIESIGLFCEYAEAENISKTLDLLDKEKMSYDLAVIDLKLEDRDKSDRNGITLLSIIKEVLNRYSQTHIIIYTAYPSMDSACAAYEAGADSYISKNDPDAPEKLKSKVKELLKKMDLRQSMIRFHEAYRLASDNYERDKKNIIDKYGGKFLVFYKGIIDGSGDDPFEIWKALNKKYTKDQRCDISIIQIPREGGKSE